MKFSKKFAFNLKREDDEHTRENIFLILKQTSSALVIIIRA